MLLEQPSAGEYLRTAPASGKRIYLRAKRFVDVILAILILIVLLPLFVLIALCIRLDSRGPVIFRQTRTGANRRRRERRNQGYWRLAGPAERRSRKDRRQENEPFGKPFTFYKFRTMHVDCDPEIHRQFAQRFVKNQIPGDCGGKHVDSLAYKMDRDPRVTRVGCLLRRTSLDELPQLFNVLKGEMSLVGPRPPLPYEVQHYQEWHKERLAVLPGITGLWQIRGRSRVPFDKMVSMDLYYIDHMSLSLDLQILLLTPWAVVSGKGAA
ncbi:MAG: sugar transferase [Chloroflexi bacterium]|nr:sugar transferase [Chloroflexota bacterium]